jgi:hypothetical protein
MENTPKIPKKANYSGNQTIIVRFRASRGLYEKLQHVAQEEELCLAALVRRLVLDSLKKFPG